ncbi:hypothetical protein SAMN05877753_101616 [Bacillus oleivorans]|uniref:Lipoprotein n=1 Tax=Bacillus oleivorans TaxID=1448271 RepID=A0A285CI67_9BACI|nr:hypothetical protein [Bacillus oleivorans]SNX67297.1 hypothetical protein SAMN05877753_101616 [Bacillus oleivorans]
MKRILLVALLLPFLLVGCGQADENAEVNPDPNDEYEPNENDPSVEEEDPTNQGNQDGQEEHLAVDELMAQYRDLASSKGKFAADEQYKVQEFQSKEEIVAEAEKFLTREFAQEVADLRYEDKEDGVYIIPMDGPVTLDETKDYNLEKVSGTEYRLTQEQTSDLHGNVQLEVIFVKQADHWVIQDVNENHA